MKTPNRIIETNDGHEQLSLHLSLPSTITEYKEPVQLSFEFNSYVFIGIDWAVADELDSYDYGVMQFFADIRPTEIVPTSLTEELINTILTAFHVPRSFISLDVVDDTDELPSGESESKGDGDGDAQLLEVLD